MRRALDFVGEAGRVVEPQCDRLFDPRERALRAAGECVEVLPGEIEPPRDEPRGNYCTITRPDWLTTPPVRCSAGATR